MSEFGDGISTHKIGDGSKSECDINGNGVSDRFRRSGVSSTGVYEGRNWELVEDKSYSYFTVTTSPTGRSVALKQSISSSFGPRKTPLPVTQSKAWVAVPIAALTCVVLVTVILVKFRRKNKSDGSNVDSVAIETAMPSRDDANAESAYVNASFVRKSKTSISLENLDTAYNEMKAGDYEKFKLQFEELRNVKVDAGTTIASDTTLKKKNRYKNILPYDHSRVIIGTGDAALYINACYIDGYQEPKKFIATQGPLPDTVSDFWLMALQEETEAIVMLAKCREQGKSKCTKYWPDLGSSSQYGDIIVHNTEVAQLGGFVRRSLKIKRADAEEQSIHQYQFLNWPDHGVPLTTSTFDRLHKAVEHSQNAGRSNSPIIVHCSAGAGRTGAFIAYDILREEAQQSHSVDVFGCVTRLREQRMQMVQTWEQYVLIHKMILECYLFQETDMTAEGVKDKLEHSESLSEEFEKLNLVGPMHTEMFGNEPRRQEMNRDPAVIPYDKCKLTILRQPDDTAGVYINASKIETYDAAIPMIAAQGPMKTTEALFWRAVWDNNVNTIVMLTELDEDGLEQCVQYWPDGAGKSRNFSNILVTLNAERISEDEIIKRTFGVTRGEETKKIVQYHYTGWRSDSTPANATMIIDIISNMVSNIRSEPDAYGLIHCSDGAGRTGAFCTIVNLIERLKCENKVDVFRAVKDLRDGRKGMVQTLEQYEFCHRAVLDYLSSFALYSNYCPAR